MGLQNKNDDDDELLKIAQEAIESTLQQNGGASSGSGYKTEQVSQSAQNNTTIPSLQKTSTQTSSNTQVGTAGSGYKEYMKSQETGTAGSSYQQELQNQSTDSSSKKSTQKTYSNEEMAKIMADAGGGNESDLLNQLNSNEELSKQAQDTLAKRDKDYADLVNKQEDAENMDIATKAISALSNNSNTASTSNTNTSTNSTASGKTASSTKSTSKSTSSNSKNQTTATNSTAKNTSKAATTDNTSKLDTSVNKKLTYLQNKLDNAKKSGDTKTQKSVQAQIDGFKKAYGNETINTASTSAKVKTGTNTKATDTSRSNVSTTSSKYTKEQTDNQYKFGTAALLGKKTVADNTLASGTTNSKTPDKTASTTRSNAALTTANGTFKNAETTAKANTLVSKAESGKLSKAEKKEAKKVVKEYASKIRSGETLSDEDMSNYTTLQNATSLGASFMGGLINSFTLTKNVAEKVGNAIGKLTGDENAGTKAIASLEKQNDVTKNQNNVANVAGNFAGKATQYSAFNTVADAAGATEALENVINSKLGTQGFKTASSALADTAENAVATSAQNEMKKQLASKMANILVGQTADTAFDTIPTILENQKSGKYSSDSTLENVKNIAGDVASNQLQNFTMNAVTEALPSILDAIKGSDSDKAIQESVQGAVKNTTGIKERTNVDNYMIDTKQDAKSMGIDLSGLSNAEVAKKDFRNKVEAYLESQDILTKGIGTIGEDNTSTIREAYQQAAKYKEEMTAAADRLKQEYPDYATDVDDLLKSINADDAVTSATKAKANYALADDANVPYPEAGMSYNAREVMHTDADYAAMTNADFQNKTITSQKGKRNLYKTNYDANKTVSGYQTIIDDYVDRYGIQDEQIEQAVNRAKRAVNDMTYAVTNRSDVSLKQSVDEYKSAIAEIKKHSSEVVDGFNPSSMRSATSISASGSRINAWQKDQELISSEERELIDYNPTFEDALSGKAAANTAEDAKKSAETLPAIESEALQDTAKQAKDSTNEIPSIKEKNKSVASKKDDGSIRMDVMPERNKTGRDTTGTSLENMPKVADTVEPDGFQPTHYQNSYGIVPVTDWTKEHLSGTKKIIVNDGNNFKNFVNQAVSDKTYNKNFLYAQVSDELASDIKASTGLETSGYNIMVNGGRIRKEFSHHGSAREGLRGQNTLTTDTIENFAKVFDNPDSIKVVTDENGIPSIDSDNRRMLQFEKRIDGTEIVVTGVSDGKTALHLDSFYERKAKKVSGRADSSPKNSPSPTSNNASATLPSLDNSVKSAAEDVNSSDTWDQLVSSVNNRSKTTSESAKTIDSTAPANALNRVEERMNARTAKTDADGYVGKGYTNTIKNSGLATEEQYEKGLEGQTRHFVQTEKETYTQAKNAYNSAPEDVATKYSKTMSKDELGSWGAIDVDTAHIVYGNLNQKAKDATTKAEAEMYRRQASRVAANLTDAQHYNAQALQANAKWRGTFDGAMMAVDGTVNKLVDNSLTPKAKDDLDSASQAIKDLLQKAIDNNENLDDKWKGVKNILDQYKNLKDRVTDEQIQTLTEGLLKDKDWEGIQNLLAQDVTGYGTISQDVLDKASELFEEAQKYNYNSKQYMELEDEAYKTLANAIANQKGYKGDTWGQKMDATRYLMMLGNPKTIIKNDTGNFFWSGVTGAKNNLGAVIEESVDRISKATGGNGIDRTKAVLNRFSDSDKSLISGAEEYGNTYAARALSGSKYTDAGVALQKALPTYGNSKVGKAAQTLSDKVSDILENADQRAMMSKYKTSLAGYLKANGYDSSIFSDTSEEAANILAEGSQYAVHQAEEAAFHQDSTFSKALTDFVSTLKGSEKSIDKAAGTLTDATIPFKKTPANVLKSCLEYSPLEYATAFTQVKKLRDGYIKPSEFIDTISKATTGSAMLTIGAILANEGIMQVGTSKGTKEQNTDTRTGIQQNSIKLGNFSVNLSDLMPAAAPLIFGATIEETLADRTEDGKTEGFLGKVGTAAEAAVNSLLNIESGLVDMTMLSGIDNIFTAIEYKDDDESSANVAIKAAIESYVGQFLPTLGRAINSTVDETARSTYSDKTGLEGDIEEEAKYLETKIPGLQEIGEWAAKNDIPVLKNLKLEPAVDAWGNEKQNNSEGVDAYTDNGILNGLGRAVANFVSPAKVSSDTSTFVDTAIRGLQESVVNSGVMSSDDADDLFPYTKTSESKIDGEKMSPSDWTDYQKAKGQMSNELATELLVSGDYDDLSDTDKADVLQSLYDFSTTYNQAKYGKEVSSTKQKLVDAYESGGASGLIDQLVYSSEKSAFESAVKANNDDESASIDHTVDYLNTIYKEDPDQARELASQASEYQKGAYHLEDGQYVYRNGNTIKTGTESDSTIPSVSAVGSSGTDYSESARYQRYSGLGEIPGLKQGGTAYESSFNDIDSDGNGSLKKDEITSWINQMAEQNGWGQDTKRSVYAAFAPSNWHNPY